MHNKWFNTVWVAIFALMVFAFPQFASAHERDTLPPPIAAKLWWQNPEVSAIVGKSLKPLKGHEQWLVEEARIFFACDEIRSLLIRMSPARFAQGAGDTLLIRFGAKIHGYDHEYQAGNQMVFLTLAAVAGRFDCDKKPEHVCPKPDPCPECPKKAGPDISELLLLMALFDKLDGENNDNKGKNDDGNNGKSNCGCCCCHCDDNKDDKTEKESLPREWTATYTPDAAPLLFTGRYFGDYFEGAGGGAGVGTRDFSQGITVLLALYGHGITSIDRWSFGPQLTPMFGIRGYLASGINIRQSIITVPTRATKTVTVTDQFGNVTTTITDGDVQQPAAITRVTAAKATGSLAINAGLGWDNKVYLLLQAGYDVTSTGNGWNLGGLIGGERFRGGASYNLETKTGMFTFSIFLK